MKETPEQRYRRRMKEQGFVYYATWIPKGDVPALRDYVKKLRDKYRNKKKLNKHA